MDMLLGGNNTTLNNGSALYGQQDFSFPFYILFYTMAVFISASSGLILLAHAVSHEVRKSLNIYLVSFLVSQFQLGCVFLPISVEYPEGSPRLSSLKPASCIVVTIWPKTIFGAAMWNVFLVSLDRYVAVKWPMKYHSAVTSFQSALAVLVTWAGLLVVGFFPVYGQPKPTKFSLRTRCGGYYVVDKRFQTYSFVMNLFAPLALTTIFYTLMYTTAREKTRTAIQCSGTGERSPQKVLFVAWTCLTVSIVFTVGWLPFLLLLGVKNFCERPECILPLDAGSVGNILGFLLLLGCLACLLNLALLWKRCKVLRETASRWSRKVLCQTAPDHCSNKVVPLSSRERASSMA